MFSIMGQIWQTFVKNSGSCHIRQLFMIRPMPSEEPKVSWKRDRQGNSHLEIYDPTTAKRHYFSSEKDALIWVEKRR